MSDRLSAFYDGELDSASAAEMRRHIESCPQCAAELAALKAMSDSFAQSPRTRLSQMGLYRLHDAADSMMHAGVLRTARVLRAVAACVIVATSLWMMRSGMQPSTANSSAQNTETVAAAPPWMDVAVATTEQTNSLDATTPAAAWYLASVASRSDDLP